jgi:DNA-binding IclR family transcriptional regulator
MSSEDRQHQILALARSQGEVDVLKLAAELGVAPETIRRDLRQLEQHGLVRRTHGGAYPVETARFETTLEGTSPIFLVGFVTSEGLFLARLCAAATLVSLPVVLAGWIAQKQLVRGLSMGAVK